MNASYKRPHRLALLATSPVATGEAKQEEPRKGTETRHLIKHVKHFLFISKPYPRKGTETLVMKQMCREFQHHFKTISPQGDGAYLQPPLPERGRGTA